jgi:hypothetical protein
VSDDDDDEEEEEIDEKVVAELNSFIAEPGEDVNKKFSINIYRFSPSRKRKMILQMINQVLVNQKMKKMLMMMIYSKKIKSFSSLIFSSKD